jgi:DHA2 family multidrug resistance protein
MIGGGLLGFAFGVFEASHVTKDWDFQELIAPQVFRGVSLMFCMIPVNNLALGTMPVERMKNASGLFNLTRNLGGAIGLALINTMLNKRLDLHLARLHEFVSWSNERALETLSTLTRLFTGRRPDAELAATKQLAALVRRDALAMSLGDVFLALALLFVAAVVLVPLMKRPRDGIVAGGH